jgi:lysophospholipid acyltransferase (LPLAT)-like uncharacterized protein
MAEPLPSSPAHAGGLFAAVMRKLRSIFKMKPGRALLDRMLTFLGYLALEFWWRTCRIQIEGEERVKALVTEHGSILPVCWHQHLLLVSRWAVGRRIPGMKIGFLISPSRDGNAPSTLAQWYGATTIRGSSTHTGPQALRTMYKQIRDEKISPFITPDGPKGPRFEFKGGAIVLAQLCGVPVVPIAFSAKTASVMRTWDKFVLPRPFTKVVLQFGEPFMPPRKASAEELQQMQQQMAERMHETYRQAAAKLNE